jgi:transcriptional regulator with XRE-family HTH domain
MNIGERLRELRIKMKKTLQEQSEICGVSANSIYRWEHGLAQPRKSSVRKLAEYYDVPLEWLLRGVFTAEDMEYGGETPFAGGDTEQQLLKMFRKLSDNNKYKILGYIERIYVESLDHTFVELKQA